jgi:dTDP-L-rhamnose 4-epimerase
MLRPVPTPEDKLPSIASVYALSKFDQERMCLMLGQAYGIDTVALRLFNVYGPHQALSNPYTGVMAIFATRLLHDRPPIINEDGLQRRDFVNVRDVVEAFVLALNTPAAAGRVYNIASGTAITIQDVARLTAAALGKAHIAAHVSGQYRVGDIRHCFANISAARHELGFEPRVDLGAGLSELAGWIARGQPAEDRVEHARHELASRGLAL